MKKAPLRQWMTDTVVAAVVAGLLSVLPSTLWAFAFGGHVWRVKEALLTPGALLVGRDAWIGTQIFTTIVVHGGLSLFWAGALCAFLPKRRPVINGMGAAFSIAVLDLLVIAQSFPAVHSLVFLHRSLDSFWPWLADHLVFGAVVGAVVAFRRRRNASEESIRLDEQAAPGSRLDGTAGRVLPRVAIGLSLVVGMVGFVIIIAIKGGGIEELFFGLLITTVGPPMKLCMGESVRWEIFAPLSLLLVGLIGIVLSIRNPSRIGWLFCAHACLLAYYIMAHAFGKGILHSISC